MIKHLIHQLYDIARQIHRSRRYTDHSYLIHRVTHDLYLFRVRHIVADGVYLEALLYNTVHLYSFDEIDVNFKPFIPELNHVQTHA